MKTILQINASLNSVNGESSKLADQFVAGLKRQHPGAQVILRDLAREPVPHLDAERFGSFIVRYTEKGPVGLLTGKKAWVLATRGGRYAGIVGENAGDHETPFVRQFLGFLGITEVEFVYAEGLAISEASKQQAPAMAQNTIRNFEFQERIAA